MDICKAIEQVTRKPRHGPSPDCAKRIRIVKAYCSGQTISQIATATSSNPGTIWKVLKIAGVLRDEKARKQLALPKRLEALKAFLKKRSYQTSSNALKQRLVELGFKKMECEQCGWKRVAPSGTIPVELHHMNGDPTDDRLENLQILCPNCHSLTTNYRNRKRGPVS